MSICLITTGDGDRVRYFWAGRDDADRTDGLVRAAEIEVYGSEEAALLPALDKDTPAGDAALDGLGL